MDSTASQLAGPDPSHLAQVAQRSWLGRAAPQTRVQPDVVKTELWDYLEKQNFDSALIHELESLQCFELYLWPSWTEDASHYHALLIILLLNAKRREGLPSWTLLTQSPNNLTSLFSRIRSLALDADYALQIRTHVLTCLVGAFQSLDVGLIRKECAPLVSIGTWHNIHSDEARSKLLEQSPQLKKAWRAWNKRYEAADAETREKLDFDRSWLFCLLLEFFKILHDEESQNLDALLYCERFLELVTDIQSQFPTRRYANTLFKDLNLLIVIKLSPLYSLDDAGLLRDFCALLEHYTNFPINDHTGLQLTKKEVAEGHANLIASLQRTAIKHFKEKLNLLALANYGAICKRTELIGHLQGLQFTELAALVDHLGLRTSYPSGTAVTVDQAFLQEVVVLNFAKQPSLQEIVKKMTILPTEKTLYDPAFLRNESYNALRPVALPKLNLQYLTTADFLYRSLVLSRCEAFYEIRTHLLDVLKRMQPRGQDRQLTSKMGFRIRAPAIIHAIQARVGENIPAEVKAEIILDTSRTPDNVRREWEDLRAEDTVFLVAAKQSGKRALTNGHTEDTSLGDAPFSALRVAEVIQVLDENSKPLRHAKPDFYDDRRRPRQRRLMVRLDAAAYAADMKAKASGKPDVYETINTVIRRKGRENNFKPVLESIKSLTLSDSPLPSWLQDVFLGMGDPSGASFPNIENSLALLDFRDTFVDWKHVQESFAPMDVAAEDNAERLDHPPYVVSYDKNTSLDGEPGNTKKSRQNAAGASKATAAGKPQDRAATHASSDGQVRTSRKRGRDEIQDDAQTERIRISTYLPPDQGPYPTDKALLNKIRFTPTQIQAIASGSQPGLTVIVGPPGTGKTDVTTQIVNNLYHNFASERILLLAHSNQALNQLFEKITALDIDQRHLLRLGQGEKDLQVDNETSYGNQGRVEYFMAKGAQLLVEVNRLAASLRAPGAHGSNCETADYFNQVYVQPIWKSFVDRAADQDDSQAIAQAFPFHAFFSDAPQPLIPASATKEQALEIAKGCYRHIEKVFVQLEDIRPFEVLRRDREKANYLLVREARVIAMTTTYAAMRHHEIVKLGFHYDSLIMEEAAQVTEVDTLIPMALQKPPPDPSQSRLKRVVLCGDHLQNSPIVQNNAVRQYGGFEQSLFQRLIRLGVPHIQLDAQGRARGSLASLYAFRYPKLRNLAHVETLSEFIQANAGLRWDYQFIDVPDYKGKGETMPSPHFRQNLGEAEYVVALYMYMRLLGYPARQISILTMYAGQRALIRDVLGHRCANNRLFGMPRAVSTVDKYQGEQNDYVLLSLVRTRSAGYMRDPRRLTVALSRARLGLYVFGRREVFESNAELAHAFGKLLARPAALQLATDEMFPTDRKVDDEAAATDMQGLEHLGQYVFEMSKAKAQALRENGGVLPEVSGNTAAEDDDDDAFEEEGPGEVDDE